MACGVLLAASFPCAVAFTKPVPLIFDTDMGNDIDDALALALIHEFADRGETRLLAVTLSKDNPWAAVYVDLVNTFYGRPEIPVGLVRGGKTPEDGSYTRPPAERMRDGKFVYPRNLKSGADAPDATHLLRKTLAAAEDGSVVMVSVGFLTNMARLLDSKPDDASPLSGEALIREKLSLYVAMAGAFRQPRQPEYNVYIDAEASRTVFARWPTRLVASGFEIGLAIPYPAQSIEKDFGYIPDHPIAEAYRLYMKMPYHRPTWDLTAVLYAVRPDHDYFGLSYPGKVALGEKNVTEFAESRDGRHQYLTATPEQAARVREALVQLVSSPPGR